ncbi:MAG: GTP-binding protein [Candidatus Methanomethylophilaceae archaeon]|jgi:G3E family GTPase|nr:GTP-binding protein [Candidatus Methanomethylophilaceae archaeon]
MHVLVVAGMLGAGKTSTIIQLLGPLSAGGRKVAIIENEIGSVGIDGEVLNKNGLQIKELAGGCVCCTLKSGMIDTLKLLQKEVGPDIVVIEPTGIADPEYILVSIDGVVGLDIDSVKVVVVIDGERFLRLKTMFERPLRNQLEMADLVLINKVDAISPQDLRSIEDQIRSFFKYAGKILHVRGDTGEGMDVISKEIGL